MKSKVYYGEYSLRHWVNMILNTGVELPGYQRYFVWDKKQVQKLIKSFEDKEFIPPVTVGRYYEGGSAKNYILDGQQRLTSLLLAYLNCFPKRSSYQVNSGEIQEFADENDDSQSEESNNSERVMKWNFTELISENKNTREKILGSINRENYDSLDLELDDSFFEENFLGFSFILPVDNSSGSGTYTEDQQRFYASVFRNINIQGRNLKDRESRAALYFLRQNLDRFFNPSQLERITVNRLSIDFVRYLSLASQYKVSNSYTLVAKGYAKRMESYYEDFIYSVVGGIEEPANSFYSFTDDFLNSEFEDYIEKLIQYIDQLSIEQNYSTIIDADMDLFGLIFFTIIEQKNLTLDSESIESLKQKIKEKTEELKRDNNHIKSPGALKWVQKRIDESIKIYREYFN